MSKHRPSAWNRKRIMKCDGDGCTDRGINHLYQDGNLIGKYCDKCVSIYGSRNCFDVKRYPRAGSREYVVIIAIERLKNMGIKATKTKDMGIRICVADEDFDKEAILQAITP